MNYIEILIVPVFFFFFIFLFPYSLTEMGYMDNFLSSNDGLVDILKSSEVCRCLFNSFSFLPFYLLISFLFLLPSSKLVYLDLWMDMRECM